MQLYKQQQQQQQSATAISASPSSNQQQGVDHDASSSHLTITGPYLIISTTWPCWQVNCITGVTAGDVNCSAVP
jgi:hypothetical protein